MNLKGRTVTLTGMNIRQGLVCLPVKNTLAYYVRGGVKKVLLNLPEVLFSSIDTLTT